MRFVQLLDYLDEWCLLYEYLSQRHDFGETHLFSRDYFLALALMKELKAVGVFMGEELVSCYLWFVYGEKAYLHLGGSSAKGYHSGATYLAIDFAVSSFQQCQYLDIGGTPDQGKLSPEGLNQFKRGFTRNTRKNWICGSIIQPDIYSELCLSRGIDPKIKGFFPAYRTPLRNKG